MDELGSQLWPIHLKPKENELLSSWVIRLAHAHGYKTEKICHMLFGRNHALWSRDLDRLAPESVLSTLVAVTGTTADRARQTTLSAYAGHITERVNSKGYSPWIVPLHVYHRQRTKPGLMYCPSCLGDDADPFYRKTWRLGFITCCVVHGHNLLDTCEACGSAVIPHRVDIGPSGLRPRDRSFVRCWNCGHDLRASSKKVAEGSLLHFTQHLEEVLNSGYVLLGDNPSLHAVPYFVGMRILARIASKAHGLGRSAIELLLLRDRLPVLQRMAKMLESWPDSFLEAVDRSSFRYSDYFHKGAAVPFWIEEAARSLKCNRHPSRSNAEVAEITRTIVERHGHMSLGIAREQYGLHLRTRRVPPEYRPTVSTELHLQLMSHIERSIQMAKDARGREALSQDKVIFCVLRYAGISAQRVATLLQSDLPALLHDKDEHDEFDVPTSRNGALRMLQDFAANRPSRRTHSTRHGSIFVSPYTGHAMSESTIQLRFQRAVEAARLAESIPDLMAYKRNI
jgi:hypothetical protein